MGTEQEFDMKTDGSVMLGDKVPSADLPEGVEAVVPPAFRDAGGIPVELPKRQSMLPMILEKIHDPNYPLEEVNRLIAIEIAGVAQDMGTLRRQAERTDFTEHFLQKCYDQQIKALAALEKSLTNTDIQRHRDILNFDGPKFQYAFGEFVNWFKLACQQALGRDNETMVQSIMKHYRDIAAMGEAELRSATEKIDSKGNR